MAVRLLAVSVALAIGGCASAPRSTPDPTVDLGASAKPSISATPSPATPTASATASSEPVAWEQLQVAGPAAREDHTWTVSGDGRTAYLFGGRDGGTPFADLWSFDLETDTWTEVAARAGPAARFGHEAVWVDDIGLVVFAGQAGTAFFNDLWAFDPTNREWRQLPAAGEVPVSRYGTCAAVGPDGRLWISHGFTSDGARFSDTRAYDFTAGAWTDETPADGRPVERCLHGCWWTDAGDLALYAGQTTGVTALGDRWALADGSWSRLEGSLPPDRNLYAHARVGAATLVFGGQAVDESFLADLWLLSDSDADATSVSADGGGPPPRAGAGLIHDTAGERVLLFGGRNETGVLADTWQLHGYVASDR